MSLLCNMLSRLVIAFLPRSKRLLISWLPSASAGTLEPRKYSLSFFPLFPHLFAMKWWDQMPWFLLSECWILSQLFYFPLSLSSRGSSVPPPNSSFFYTKREGDARCFFGTLAHHLLGLLAFQIKSPFLAQQLVSHLLACNAVSSTILD